MGNQKTDLEKRLRLLIDDPEFKEIVAQYGEAVIDLQGPYNLSMRPTELLIHHEKWWPTDPVKDRMGYFHLKSGLPALDHFDFSDQLFAAGNTPETVENAIYDYYLAVPDQNNRAVTRLKTTKKKIKIPDRNQDP